MTEIDKFGRPLKAPASTELLRNLRDIAAEMIHVVDPNCDADPKHVRELGTILMRITNGEDARRLFRQHERTKPSNKGEHRVRALAYWAQFGQDPESHANRCAAIEAARTILPLQKKLADSTIKRIAGDHRKSVLGDLQQRTSVVFEFGPHHQVRCLGKQKVANLCAYLKKKSQRTKHR